MIQFRKMMWFDKRNQLSATKINYWVLSYYLGLLWRIYSCVNLIIILKLIEFFNKQREQILPRTKQDCTQKWNMLRNKNTFVYTTWLIQLDIYHSSNLIPAWISNYIHYEARDEITHPFQNFNSTTVYFWELISNFIPHFTVHMITYQYLDWS